MTERVMKLRPEVAWFAQQMEKALRRNDHKGGWRCEDDGYLLDRLEEERAELASAVSKRRKAATIAREAADVANFAMMLADNARSDEESVE